MVAVADAVLEEPHWRAAPRSRPRTNREARLRPSRKGEAAAGDDGGTVEHVVLGDAEVGEVRVGGHRPEHVRVAADVGRGAVIEQVDPAVGVRVGIGEPDLAV